MCYTNLSGDHSYERRRRLGFPLLEKVMIGLLCVFVYKCHFQSLCLFLMFPALKKEDGGYDLGVDNIDLFDISSNYSLTFATHLCNLRNLSRSCCFLVFRVSGILCI